MCGYQHPAYAESLAEYGAPRALPRSKGWILQRPIPDSALCDAMGCYPLFACQDWSALEADLQELGTELVSLSMVADPFGEYDVSDLHNSFPAVMRPFKQHYIVDLRRPMSSYVSAHHRRYAHRALSVVDVDRPPNPVQVADQWTTLYATLVDRHQIRGIPAFSSRSLTRQLRVPGTVLFRASFEEATVGILVWYAAEEVGYYHLGASSDLGYELRASFALFWTAIDYFASIGLKWLNLGGGAGLQDDTTDGLSRFKRGWSTGTCTAYFCGRTFDERAYADLVRSRGIAATNYFPVYRKGEFG